MADHLVRIIGPDDPRIADYRDVPDPELVRARGLFVAEGRLVVERLIVDGRCAVRSLLVNGAAHRALEPVLARLPSDTPVYVCEATDFQSIIGFRMHRGCLALAVRPPAVDLRTILSDSCTLVALDGVANADNVGGVFRNAAAFGVNGVLLSQSCCDPLYRKAIRTSMGATLRVPFVRLDSWPDDLRALRADGFTLVALTPHAPALTLDEFVSRGRPSRVALLVGAEGRGLDAGVADLADARVRIPINPAVDSLNLAVATGIALAQLSRMARV